MPVALQKRMRAFKRPQMDSCKTLSVLGYFCLLCTRPGDGAALGTRKPVAVHDMRDSVHQIGYNYASRPLIEATHSATTARPPHGGAQESSEVVTTLERFHRVSPDGGVEFKIALSDGQINHQKIHTEVRNGHPVQIQDGYYAVRLGNGCYRTIYYTADEMGYRILGMHVDTAPPEGFWTAKTN